MLYEDYLKSEDWKLKREQKLSKKSRCAICLRGDTLEVHHLFYRNLHDVQNSDLRVLCHSCHSLSHTLEKEGKFCPKDYKTHNGKFAALKAKVKKEKGLSNKSWLSQFK